MADNKIYPITRHSAEELAEHMQYYLADEQGMDTQRIHSDEGNFTVVQARTKGGKYKQIVGLDKGVTLRFFDAPGAVNVEIGEAKWIDKSIVMTLSMFVLCPLTVTSGIGIYEQKKLISDLIEEMDTYMGIAPDGDDRTSAQSFAEKLESKVDEISNSNAVQHIVANADKIIRIITR